VSDSLLSFAACITATSFQNAKNIKCQRNILWQISHIRTDLPVALVVRKRKNLLSAPIKTILRRKLAFGNTVMTSQATIPKPFPKRVLGSSKEKVSAIGFGMSMTNCYNNT
jgi:hypothetical protein